MIAQHKLNPADQLRPILELADVYAVTSLEHAFTTARTYNTYSHSFVRGIVEQDGTVHTASSASGGPGGSGVFGIGAPLVHADLGVYQRVLEAVG